MSNRNLSSHPQIRLVRRKKSTKLPDRKQDLRNKVIHITIGSSKYDRTSSENVSVATFSKSTDRETDITNSIIKDNHESKSISTNKIAPVESYHRKKKRKMIYQRKYLCACLCILLIAIIIAAILILIFLLKHTSNTTINVSNKTASLRWNNSGITILGTAGVTGVNSTLLNLPYGLAFDSSKALHIVDFFNNRVQKLITGTKTSVTVAGQTNGAAGSASDRLTNPVDLYLDANDNIYITDRGNNRLQFWPKNSTTAVTVAGIGSSSNISFSNPTTIVNDPSSNNLYLSDTYAHRIISYPSGVVLAGGNGAGNSYTQLNMPYGLAYDSFSKSFIIPNSATNNIVRWVISAKNRTHITGNTNGSPGATSTTLNYPIGLILDPMGNIYVADAYNHRIQMFLVDQSNGTTIAGVTNSLGTDSTHLNTPYWLLLDNQLNLYVSDSSNNRVQKFLRY